MLKKIRAIFKLSRPTNCILTAISVTIGAICSDLLILENVFQTNKNSTLELLIKAILSATLINAAGNAINDWRDKSIDLINRPDRPLPAGQLKSSGAILFASVTATMGLILSSSITPVHLVITVLVVGLLLIYSLWLKDSVFYGNLLVGLVSSSTFPFGAFVLGDIKRAWIPASFSLLFHIGREIIKDVEDIDGDQKQGLKTLPIVCGVITAQKITLAIFSFLATFTLWPFFAGIYGSIYLTLVIIYNAVIIFVFYLFIRNQTNISDGKLGRILKIAMILGLTAIAIGEIERSFLKSLAF